MRYTRLLISSVLLFLSVIINAQEQATHADSIKFKRIKLNAELGDAECIYKLAQYYEYGHKGLVEANDSIYLALLRKSAELKFSDACYSLALHYKYKQKDTVKAIEWFKKDLDYEYFSNYVSHGKDKGIEWTSKYNTSTWESLRKFGVEYKPWEIYRDKDVEKFNKSKEKLVTKVGIVEDDGYSWIRADSIGLKAALSVNKDVIVPYGNHNVAYANGAFATYDNMSLGGLYAKDGRTIVGAYQYISKSLTEGTPFYIHGRHKFGVVEITGKVLIPQIYKKISVPATDSKNSKGQYVNFYLFCYTFDNRVEVYDKNFNIIIPKERNYKTVSLNKFEPDGVYFLSCTIIDSDDSCRSAVCDLQGNELIRTPYTTTKLISIQNGYNRYQVEKGSGKGEVNQNGELVSPLQGQTEKKVQFEYTDYTLITDRNDIGRIENLQGKIILSNIINGCEVFKIGQAAYFKTQRKNNAVLYTENAQCIIDESYGYSDIQMYCDYFACTNSDGRVSLHDKNGKLILKSEYDYMMPYSRKIPYAIFAVGNKYGVIDIYSSNVVIPALFDDITIPKIYGPVDINVDEIINNYLLIKQNGLYGLTDLMGNYVLDISYDSITDFSGYIQVQKNKYAGIYRLDGTPFITPDYYTSITKSGEQLEAERRVAGKLIETKYFDIDNSLRSPLLVQEELLDEYKEQASIAFKNNRYKKAIKYYSLILEIEPNNEYTRFNRAAANYNLDKYKKAMEDLWYIKSMPDCEQEIRNKAITLLEKAQKYQAQKVEHRRQLIGDLVTLGLATTAVVVTGVAMGSNNNYAYSNAMPQYNSGNTYSPSGNESARVQQWNQELQGLMVSTAAQVHNQEMQEYYSFCSSFKKPDGSEYSIHEWRAIKGQAIQNLKDEGYDIIEENRKLLQQQREDFDREREEDKKRRFEKYGFDTSSSSSKTSAGKDEVKDNSATKYKETDRAKELTTNTTDEELDSKQQFKSGRVSSDDYHYEKKVTLYIREANSNRARFKDQKDLCKKGANYYIKIGDTYYLVNVQGGWGFNSSIMYGSRKLYFNM